MITRQQGGGLIEFGFYPDSAITPKIAAFNKKSVAAFS